MKLICRLSIKNVIKYSRDENSYENSVIADLHDFRSSLVQ